MLNLKREEAGSRLANGEKAVPALRHCDTSYIRTYFLKILDIII